MYYVLLDGRGLAFKPRDCDRCVHGMFFEAWHGEINMAENSHIQLKNKTKQNKTKTKQKNMLLYQSKLIEKLQVCFVLFVLFFCFLFFVLFVLGFLLLLLLLLFVFLFCFCFYFLFVLGFFNKA